MNTHEPIGDITVLHTGIIGRFGVIDDRVKDMPIKRKVTTIKGEPESWINTREELLSLTSEEWNTVWSEHEKFMADVKKDMCLTVATLELEDNKYAGFGALNIASAEAYVDRQDNRMNWIRLEREMRRKS